MGFVEIPNSKKLKKEVVEEWVHAKVSIDKTQFVHSLKLEKEKRNPLLQKRGSPGNKRMLFSKNKN